MCLSVHLLAQYHATWQWGGRDFQYSGVKPVTIPEASRWATLAPLIFRGYLPSPTKLWKYYEGSILASAAMMSYLVWLWMRSWGAWVHSVQTQQKPCLHYPQAYWAATLNTKGLVLLTKFQIQINPQTSAINVMPKKLAQFPTCI